MSSTDWTAQQPEFLAPRECSTDHPELRYGDEGDRVRGLQLLLNRRFVDLGLDGAVFNAETQTLELPVIARGRTPSSPLRMDGQFGSQTKGVVMFMQCLACLNPDGIVDKATWNFLCNGLAALPLLKQGAQGTQVTGLQQTLAKHHYSVTVNGQFDDQTHRAVCTFQADQHLLVDGIVGSQTWTKIIEARTLTLPCVRTLEGSIATVR